MFKCFVYANRLGAIYISTTLSHFGLAYLLK